MDLSTQVLGTTTVTALKARVHNAVLTIGRDKFTRADLAHVECFSFTAAANLSNLLAEFKPADTKDVFNRIPPLALAIPHLGAVSLAVLGAAFERKGLPSLDQWVMKHRHGAEEKKKPIVTFATIKAHSADAEAERNTKKAIKRSERTRHRERVHRARREFEQAHP
jgi:hypothetical protein